MRPKILFYMFILFLIISCKQNNNNTLIVKREGIVIKAKINNDSTFKDTVYYFNEAGILISKVLYKNGLKNGDSINYYLSGNIKNSYEFINNMKWGHHCVFDSTNNMLLYRDYFFNNLNVGSVVFYDSTGKPNKFFFIGFDNKTILGVNYYYWQGVEDKFITNLINYTGKISVEDSKEVVSVFLYLINPPKLSINYSIIRTTNNIDEEVYKIENKTPFVTFSLPLPNSKENYFIQAALFDSLKNKPLIIRRQISWGKL